MCEKTIETRNIFVNTKKTSFVPTHRNKMWDILQGATGFSTKKKPIIHFFSRRLESIQARRFCSQHLHRRRPSSSLELAATSITNAAVCDTPPPPPPPALSLSVDPGLLLDFDQRLSAAGWSWKSGAPERKKKKPAVAVRERRGEESCLNPGIEGFYSHTGRSGDWRGGGGHRKGCNSGEMNMETTPKHPKPQ